MTLLPSGFSALDPFVADWAIEGAANRARRRTTSSAAERRAFFDAGKPLLTTALERLDARPLAEHDEQERRLMLLCLSLAHVAQAIEMQCDDEDRHAPHREGMRITRAPADA